MEGVVLQGGRRLDGLDLELQVRVRMVLEI